MQNPKLKQIVFLNGKFITKDQAKISVSGLGFLYGWGLFESMRSLNGKIVYFDEHLERIKKSAKLINIKFPYTFDKLRKIIKKAIRINAFSDAHVKLILSKSDKGTDIAMIVKKYKPHPFKKYKLGFSYCISKLKQNENSWLARVKSTNYLLFGLAYLEAKKKGFDEAIILNNRGYIAEGSRSNIFLIKDKTLFAPSLECGCLNGITRRVIFDLAKRYNFKIYEGNFTMLDLYAAEEAFFTNSLMGIMPMENKCGRLTKFLSKKYNSLLK